MIYPCAFPGALEHQDGLTKCCRDLVHDENDAIGKGYCVKERGEFFRVPCGLDEGNRGFSPLEIIKGDIAGRPLLSQCIGKAVRGEDGDGDVGHGSMVLVAGGIWILGDRS